MKKLNPAIVGLLSLMLISIGASFKIFHFNGATLFLLLGFSILCVLYIPSYFIYKIKEDNSVWNILACVSAILSFVCVIAGTYLKALYYPFPYIYSYGLYSLGFITAPLFAVHYFVNRANINDVVIKLLFLFFGTIWTFSFIKTEQLTVDTTTTVGVAQHLEQCSYNLNNENQYLFEQVKKQPLDSLTLKNIEKLRKLSSDINSQLNMINEELIMVTGGREIETNGNPVGSNDVSKCNAYLIGRSKQGVLFDLHENLTLEQTILVDFNTLSKQTVLDCTSTEKWIERNFEGKPLHVHLCNLELIKHKILCAEKEIYKALIKR